MWILTSNQTLLTSIFIYNVHKANIGVSNEFFIGLFYICYAQSNIYVT